MATQSNSNIPMDLLDDLRFDDLCFDDLRFDDLLGVGGVGVGVAGVAMEIPSTPTMRSLVYDDDIRNALTRATESLVWALPDCTEKMLFAVDAFVSKWHERTKPLPKRRDSIHTTATTTTTTTNTNDKKRATTDSDYTPNCDYDDDFDDEIETETTQKHLVVPKRLRTIAIIIPSSKWIFDKHPNVVSVASITTKPLRLEFSARPSKQGNHCSANFYANEAELLELDDAEPTKLTKTAIHRLKRALCDYSRIYPIPRHLRTILLALKWGHKGIKNMVFEK